MMQTEQRDTFELPEALRLLEATPATLRALLEGLPEGWLRFQEDPEAWSPRTVLVHFIHNERTNWITRARVILSGEEVRKFPSFQQLPLEGEFENQSAAQLLAQFGDLRAQNLAALRGLKLKPADYDRDGEHPVLGTVNLRQLLATWVVHDLNHLHQIAKTLAKRYGESVGPWRPNLAILGL
ncbi:MAG TPA: DinB family protein [Candidatus Methylomirabilis sp.]|nr:DinB family protein [Candidatus Methylomirabilis sp.]